MKNYTNNILAIHSSNDLYGASRIFLKVIEIFRKKKYSVHVVLPNEGVIDEKLRKKNINFLIFNFGVFRKKYFNFFGIVSRIYLIIKSFIKFIFIIKKNNIKVVYINTSTIISPALAAFFCRIPCVYHIHEIPSSSVIYSIFISKFINYYSSTAIVVSKSVRNYWIKYGINRNKLKLIYNGFRFDKNRGRKSSKKLKKIVITNISRIIPYKGHRFLICLVENIVKKRSNIYFEVLGDTLPSYNNYFKELQNLIIIKNLENHIKFNGFHKEISTFLEKTDFFIHTPIEPDPLPTVIIEAIQMKIPIISTPLGGAKEILNNGINGLMIDSNDVEKSANKIINYINDVDLQNRHINLSINFVKENFNFNRFETSIIDTVELYLSGN